MKCFGVATGIGLLAGACLPLAVGPAEATAEQQPCFGVALPDGTDSPLHHLLRRDPRRPPLLPAA